MSQHKSGAPSEQPPDDDREPAPAGLGRRRRRLSDTETARRTLDAALAIIDEVGLTVSLDHLSLEEVIRTAGVARSAVYRRWPFKDQFYADLLREVARATNPTAVVDDESRLEPLRRALRGTSRALRTAEGRRELVLELLRLGSKLDFDAIYGSREWRTYLAVHAAVSSLTDTDLHDEVQALLAESEQRFVSRLSARYAMLTELLGFRVRPELDVTLDDLALLASSMLRGLVLSALARPQVADTIHQAQPTGAPQPRDWSLDGLGLVALIDSFLEATSDEWPPQRATAAQRTLRQALTDL